MIVIAGLGNPTSKYKGTRHNVGFEVIDMLADRYNIRVKDSCEATDVHEFERGEYWRHSQFL